MKEEAQSQSEGSFGNGVSLDADEGATDSGFSLILVHLIESSPHFFHLPLFLFMPCHSAHSFTFVVSSTLFSFCTKKVSLSVSFRNGGNS